MVKETISDRYEATKVASIGTIPQTFDVPTDPEGIPYSDFHWFAITVFLSRVQTQQTEGGGPALSLEKISYSQVVSLKPTSEILKLPLEEREKVFEIQALQAGFADGSITEDMRVGMISVTELSGSMILIPRHTALPGENTDPVVSETFTEIGRNQDTPTHG